MADKLINKQLVDIDELLQFLSDNGFDIDDGVWNKHEMSLREVFDEYKEYYSRCRNWTDSMGY
jgi:hypothetical protein